MLGSTRITANPTGTVRPVKLVKPTTGFGSSAISVQAIVQRPRESPRSAPLIPSLAIGTSARRVGDEDRPSKRGPRRGENVETQCTVSPARSPIVSTCLPLPRARVP